MLVLKHLLAAGAHNETLDLLQCSVCHGEGSSTIERGPLFMQWVIAPVIILTLFFGNKELHNTPKKFSKEAYLYLPKYHLAKIYFVNAVSGNKYQYIKCFS